MLSRVEIKHAVPEGVAAEVLAWARPFLPPDRGRPGAQLITSMYLDSPELEFYRWHRDGRSRRFKLRLRAYGEAADCVFAEIKQKNGRLGRKMRAAWPAPAVGALLSGAHGTLPNGAPAAAVEFVARQRAYLARPTMLVASWREALRETGWGGETAVTVDRGVVYQPTDRGDLYADPCQWRPLPLPPRDRATAIVELKYWGEQPPAWMGTLVRHLSPYRVPLSKYVSALRQHLLWSSRWI
jgi:hypothetical protein